MKNSITAIVLAAITLVIGTSSMGTQGTLHAATSEQQQDLRTLDDLFSSVASRVPAFGGMYMGKTGILEVYLTDVTQEAAAKQAISDVFGADVLKSGMQVLPGKYGFPVLRKWFDTVEQHMPEFEEVYMTDIDEVENRLTIGVDTQEAIPQVEKALAQLGIPREAVIFEVGEGAIAYSDTLRNTVRAEGGVQIQNAREGRCSLNVIARDSTGRMGFVTNSHCTGEFGAVDGESFFEPTAAPGNFVGTEVIDPPLFRASALGCRLRSRCRRSDAVFVQWGSTTRTPTIGFIARPTDTWSTLTIDHHNRFRITGQATATLAGTRLHKVGRTTGWTHGRVRRTCANKRERLSGPDVRLLCQFMVRNAGSRIADSGDSGSPVFARIGDSNDVVLHGILWGGNERNTKFWFSPIRQVEGELGALTVCVPTSGC